MTLFGPQRNPRRAANRGVTLIEMLIVLAIIGLIAGVSYPSISSGLETARLVSASDAIAGFLNQAMNRADRRQQVVEVAILPEKRQLRMLSTQAGFEKTLDLPQGVRILAVHPESEARGLTERRFYFYPGGTVPGFSIELVNGKGRRRMVRVNPITGVPETIDRAAPPPANASKTGRR
jgi:prepilin-type N-terminal cleavage/methylation domain-containing protein